MWEIDAPELRRRLSAGEQILVIDVREPWEHEIASLPRSTLIPLGALAAEAAEINPRPGTLVVTVCHHGVRSLSAAAVLEQAGVAEVASLAGGIDAWSRLVDPSVPRY
jgi:adenylyltransferase/sulfurtransferase